MDFISEHLCSPETINILLMSKYSFNLYFTSRITKVWGWWGVLFCFMLFYLGSYNYIPQLQILRWELGPHHITSTSLCMHLRKGQRDFKYQSFINWYLVSGGLGSDLSCFNKCCHLTLNEPIGIAFSYEHMFL